ncbi:hypothetical protein [Aurantiacibacter spongiae]|uniref:Cytochrome c n=1 Tax=Aurantiacibacter spongiae TaxID=2488860 RepID=A0A3N5CPK4_9SPHN|nr:hypothetical protein [Aurantiacibacter spongiae]RPF70914.1 hypothetical protein EG799_04225 [Aurantiacibacter spongiae]
MTQITSRYADPMPKMHVVVWAAAVALSGCKAEPATQRAAVQALMTSRVQPAAQIVWSSTGAASELEGGKVVNREWRPRSDAEWNAVRDASRDLQELGAVLRQSRYARNRGPDWSEFALGLSAAGKRVETSVAARDADALFMDSGYSLFVACMECHEAYAIEPGDQE